MIEKAGGIITRTNERGEREVYIVHRPRYDDWSLPKGHIDAGESIESTALREAEEETGFRCAVARALPDYEYQLPNGEHAVVHFFEMRIVEQIQTADSESDRGEWMPVAMAAQYISYTSQSEYLLTVLSK